MKFDAARQKARSGYRIRLTSWSDRWLAFDGALWWLLPVDPLSRASKPPRIVQTMDCSPEWWQGDWTTADIPRSNIEDLLAYPQSTPTQIDVRATIDGSDYLHIGDGRLRLVHRNWDPPIDVAVRVNGGQWIDWSPITVDFDIGISTAGYDKMELSVLEGRGDVTITKPWANDHAVVLIDDDGPLSTDRYWLQITLSWSLMS